MTNDQTVTQALEPCPFCGGEGLSHRVARGWRVSCKNCDAQPRPGLPPKTEAEAIAAWNTRTAPSGEGSSNGAGEDALRRAAAKFDDDVSQPRNLAVEIVDGIRGYTCEFAQSQREHEYWYDRVESLAARAALSAPQGEVERLRSALERLAKLTPASANAHTAQDLCLTVRAISESALAQPEARGER